MAARRILQNKWDNWYGYEGCYRTKEFGIDGAAAGHWLLTGDASFNAAYASEETLRAAKIAAGLPVSAEGKQGLFELNKRIRDAEAQRDELLEAAQAVTLMLDVFVDELRIKEKDGIKYGAAEAAEKLAALRAAIANTAEAKT